MTSSISTSFLAGDVDSKQPKILISGDDSILTSDVTDATKTTLNSLYNSVNPTSDELLYNSNESTTVYNSSFAIPLPTEKYSSRHQYVLYIGSGISMFSIMIALFTYTTSRKFRVKRPHMITINLCISLLIFYIGILLTASHMNHLHVETSTNKSNTSNSISAGCTAGAIFFQLGALYSWTWITVHWSYLTYTVYSVAAPHISHFFIKVTLPAYGFPTLLACFILIGDAVTTENFVQRETCFFHMDLNLIAVINFTYIAFCFGGICACITYCIMRLTCRKNKNQVVSTHMRIKMSVIRLAIITVGVVSTSVLELIRWVIAEDSEWWFEIFNGVILGTVGIVIVIGLLFRSKEFHIHWAHVIRGKKARETNVIQRALNSVRSKSKRFRRRANRNSINNAKALSPGLSSAATTTEQLSPPVKMVPRDSPGLQDVFVFPPVNQESSSEGQDNKDQNENDKEESGKIKYSSDNATVLQNGSSSFNDKNSSKKRESVSRMSSIRKKVLRTSLRKTSRKNNQTSTPSPAPEESQRASHLGSQAIEEDIEDSVTASDYDIYRKTSF